MMRTVEEIKEAILGLSPAELAAFREWFAEFEADAWDRQIEADAAAGRLDALADEALLHLKERDQDRAAQLSEFNAELGRRLTNLDRGEFVDPAEAHERLRYKSKDRRDPEDSFSAENMSGSKNPISRKTLRQQAGRPVPR